MSGDGRGPGVPFPPPFIFVGAWLIAWGLHTRVPFEIAGGGVGVLQGAGGSLLLAAGLGAVAAGLITFRRHRTAVIPHRDASTLVRSGPYRLTRNPMYLGLTWVYVGLSAVMNWAWPLLLLPMVLIVLTTVVIQREERYLQSTFGLDYREYCRHVRRWL